MRKTMQRLWAGFIVASALSACTSAPQNPGAADRASVAGDRLQPTLEGNRWSLISATDSQNRPIESLSPRNGAPLTFSFTAGRLNVTGGCNQIFGGYSVNAGQLAVTRTASTMMACETRLMEADAVLARLLLKPLQIEIVDGSAPRMQLVSASGDMLVLTGDPTLESRYGPPTVIFLEVAAQEVPCRHPVRGDMRCLQVRQRKYDDKGLQVGSPGEWRPLFETIAGFTHVEGQRNVVRVKVYQRPPAVRGTTDNVYVLDLIVETEIVAR
jgi:heat shock protein HslJ